MKKKAQSKDKKEKKATSVLLNAISANESIEDFIAAYKEDLGQDSFKLALRKLLATCPYDVPSIIHRSYMAKSYCYQILNGSREPSRDKIIQLGLGMGLDLTSLNQLLKSANKSALYAKVPRDAIFIHAFMHNKNYQEVNRTLEEHGQIPL